MPNALVLVLFNDTNTTTNGNNKLIIIRYQLECVTIISWVF